MVNAPGINKPELKLLRILRLVHITFQCYVVRTIPPDKFIIAHKP